ncbi:MAG: hypothetical protein J7M16_10265, partial [Anaerolineae bacterium]|nr:hypothetical protein [Anaerolineae bacterium]
HLSADAHAYRHASSRHQGNDSLSQPDDYPHSLTLSTADGHGQPIKRIKPRHHHIRNRVNRLAP